eukprot:2615563-Rhodomonas_salina.2
MPLKRMIVLASNNTFKEKEMARSLEKCVHRHLYSCSLLCRAVTMPNKQSDTLVSLPSSCTSSSLSHLSSLLDDLSFSMFDLNPVVNYTLPHGSPILTNSERTPPSHQS